eukprot:187776-Pleurochrysis_carterae.AAC.1
MNGDASITVRHSTPSGGGRAGKRQARSKTKHRLDCDAIDVQPRHCPRPTAEIIGHLMTIDARLSKRG